MSWEYVVVKIHEDHWGDSSGAQGRLGKRKLPSSGDWFDPAPRFNQLGAEGWEAVTALGFSESHSQFLFKRVV